MKKLLAFFILTCSISSIYADYYGNSGCGAYGQSGYGYQGGAVPGQSPQYKGSQGGMMPDQDMMNPQYRYRSDNGQSYNNGDSYRYNNDSKRYSNGSSKLYGDDDNRYNGNGPSYRYKNGNGGSYRYDNDAGYSNSNAPTYRYNNNGSGASYSSHDDNRYTKENGASKRYGSNDNSLWGDQDGASSQYGSQGQSGSAQNSDQRLKAQLKDSLQKDMSNKYTNVNVSVDKGCVTLKGTVPSNKDKDAIEQKLHSMPGVQSIDNQISVQK